MQNQIILQEIVYITTKPENNKQQSKINIATDEYFSGIGFKCM